jgi:bla regulator protein BlaR1
MENFIPSLLKVSWQAALLILLILAAQFAFGKRLSPRWRYGLWLLVLIRLAIPWTTPSRVSLFNLLGAPFSHTSTTPATAAPAGPGSSTGHSLLAGPSGRPQLSIAYRIGAGQSAGNSPIPWLFVFWSAGALSLSGYLAFTHRRISRKVTLLRPLIDARVLKLLEGCKKQMGVRAPVTLVESRAVGSPALFGFVRPRLLFPIGLAQSFSPEELRYVFLHELGHIKRHDILIGWVMTALQILHWFNPLVWLASYRMRADRELACDALVLSCVQKDENQAYGRTILKLLESFGRSAWGPSLAGTVENKNQMKERILMIAKFDKSNRGLALALVLFAGLGLITMTDAQPATSPPAHGLVGSWVLVGKPGEAGEPPAAGGRIKLITERQWSITQADPKTGVVIFHHGGTYTLKGNEYNENVEYANQNTKDLVGTTTRFTIKLEGDTLTLTGIGNPWNEVWKRVK